MEKLTKEDAQALHSVKIGTIISSIEQDRLIRKGYIVQKLGGLALTTKGQLYEVSKGAIPEEML